MPVKRDVGERFWEKVDKSGDCWEWTAYVNRAGYGQFQFDFRDCRNAHRVAYQLAVGPIPAGLVIDHLCRNRACVNPAHLEPVTNAENIRRGLGTSVAAPISWANRRARTECKYGHPFDEANTSWFKGRRACRACHTRLSREHARRKRAALKATQ